MKKLNNFLIVTFLIITMSQSSEVLSCTCGDDLIRNGGHIHNYSCPCTPKCKNPVMRINIQTGEIEQVECGSRFEIEYACHGNGCPLLELCPHCGSQMDQRAIHHYDCPNNPYTRYHAIFQGIINLSTSLPTIVDKNFVVSDDCSLCLLPFSKCQNVMKPSECNHCYHSDCMMKWIQSENRNNRKCPICRIQINSIFQQKLKDS